MRYLLFVPESKFHEGDKSVPLETVAKLCGFEDHLGGHAVIGVAPEDSPTGEAGKLIGWQKPGDNQLIVKKDDQVWITNAKYGYSVGMWKNSPPTESDLRRDITQRGEFLNFGDPETGWKITRPDELDARVIFTAEGDPSFVPIAKFSYYTDAIDKCVQTSEEDGRKYYRWSIGDAARIVMLSLRLNYRLLPEVANHINLMSLAQVDRAFRRIMDMKQESEGE